MESALLYVLGVVIVVVGLVISIGLHEVGHLVPAKLFGVRVGQYMIGFGKTLFSRKVGETEYGLKMIPLGGYISMAGMFPPARAGGKPRTASTGYFDTLVQDARDAAHEGIPAGQEDRVFYKLPVPKRILIMLGGPFMNLVLAFVFFGIVLVGFGIPQTSTTIGTVYECVVPADSTQTECAADDPAAPAAEAGLLPGDRLISIDGQPIGAYADSSSIITDSAGTELQFVVERNGDEVTLAVTPLLTDRPVFDAEGEADLRRRSAAHPEGRFYRHRVCDAERATAGDGSSGLRARQRSTDWLLDHHAAGSGLRTRSVDLRGHRTRS